MILTSSFTVDAPMERVFDALVDVEGTAPQLPGARVTGRDDDGGYRADLRLRLGSSTVTYRGSVRIGVRDREAGALRIEAEAREARGGGSARATADVRLREGGGPSPVTTVSLLAEVGGTGRAAAAGAAVVERTVQSLLERFGRALTERLTTGGGGAERQREEAGDMSENEATEAAAASGGAPDAGAAVRAPGPEGDAGAEQPVVRGSVRLMTEEPVVLPAGSGSRDLGAMLRRRPWLAPAVLLGALALLLLLRRRG